jgi:hypothetical protein
MPVVQRMQGPFAAVLDMTFDAAHDHAYVTVHLGVSLHVAFPENRGNSCNRREDIEDLKVVVGGLPRVT